MKKLSFPFRGLETAFPAGLFLSAIVLFLSLFSHSAAQIWEDFTIWYDGNGADAGYISEERYKSGSNDVILKMNEASAGSTDIPYTKSGCFFEGWSLFAEGSSVIAPILPGGSVWDPVDVPITWVDNKHGFVFYARWDCDSYVVTYDGNGADSGKLNPQRSAKLSSVSVKSENGIAGDMALYRYGYIFTGWNTKPDGTGFAASSGSIITLDSDYHFYAMWLPEATAAPSVTPTVVPSATPTGINFNEPASTVQDIPLEIYEPTAVVWDIPLEIDEPTASATSVVLSVTQLPGAEPTPLPTALFDPSKMFGSSGSLDEHNSVLADAADVSLLIIPAVKSGEPNEGSPEKILLDRNLQLMNDPDVIVDYGITDQQVFINPADIKSGMTADMSSLIIPANFTTDIGTLETLPNTGITSRAGFLNSNKPSSVHFQSSHMELQIPGINLTGEIVAVNRTENGYPLEWLESDIALLADMALPGKGVCILAAHNTLDADIYGPFAMIHSMEIGDRFFIRDEKNEMMVFEVYSNRKINEYDFEALYKSGYLYENTVTLLTCEDERPDGGYANRRIVSGKLVG